MRLLIAVSLVAIACASSAPPMRPGGPSDSHAQEGPVAPASPVLTGAAGISRSESGSAPMMGNMQMGAMGDGNMQQDMGGMQMGGSSDGGMQHDMGGMKMDGMDGGMKHDMGGMQMGGMDGGMHHEKGGKHQKQGGTKMDGGMGGMKMDGMGGMDGGMR